MTHTPELDALPPFDREGFLLIASPELRDPNFRRSVVLMIQHDEDGAFGLVLNRPLDHRLADVLDADVLGSADPRWGDVPLHQGGPVQTNMLQFVSRDVGRGRTIVRDVMVSGDLTELLEAQEDVAGVRAYAGYAGWGDGQLEAETRDGSWIVRPAQAHHVFEVPADRLWVTVLREMGGSYAWMSLSEGDPTEN